jgi:CRISPR-associated protein Cas5d
VDPQNEKSSPISETRDLGFMLYDLDYSDEQNIRPSFFRAKIENGIVEIPDWNSAEVKK